MRRLVPVLAVVTSLLVPLLGCSKNTPEAVCDHIDALVEASMKVKPTPSQAAEARSNCVERMRDKDAACRDCAMRARSRADVMACKCL